MRDSSAGAGGEAHCRSQVSAAAMAMCRGGGVRSAAERNKSKRSRGGRQPRARAWLLKTFEAFSAAGAGELWGACVARSCAVKPTEETKRQRQGGEREVESAAHMSPGCSTAPAPDHPSTASSAPSWAAASAGNAARASWSAALCEQFAPPATPNLMGAAGAAGQ